MATQQGILTVARREVRRAAALAGLAVVSALPAAAEDARPLRAFLAGAELPADLPHRIVVEQDAGQPDMAVITLGGRAGRDFAARVVVGEDVWVGAAGMAAPLFTGEVVAVEPACDDRAEGTVIRVRNRLHRLAAEPRTQAFAGLTDAEIVERLAAEHGLEAAPAAGMDVRHDEVHQHNQTDLEFLRARAARIGFEVWCEDAKVVVGPPEEVPIAVLAAVPGAAGEVRLARFHARLSSSDTVHEVAVRGWDPNRRLEIAGKATVPVVPLGQADPGAFGRTEAFTVDHPIFSVAEAQGLAAARLEALLAAHTSEAEAQGAPALGPGHRVEVRETSTAFDGKYLVRGVSHRYTHRKGDETGYATRLKLRREDQGLYVLPGIDDEVLVAFEAGDLGRPYVVGSLWDDGGDACPARE